MGKFLNSIVIGYNLNIVKDIDMRSSDSYTECYRQYIHDVTYGHWGHPTPRNEKLLNISKTVEIPTPKPYTFLFVVLRGIQWYVGHDHWGQPHPQEKEIAEYILLSSP
jgi:hypothetical protein